MQNKVEPKRHHYIPQFILKNFSINSSYFVKFYDKRELKRICKKTSEVFMEDNLYEDKINCQNDIMAIEKDLAKFECEVAPIIKKFLINNELLLTDDENNKLQYFFALMGFRSSKTKKFFKLGLSKKSKKYYKNYQGNNDFEDFWKRNLSKLVKCRTLKEVVEKEDIDEIIKGFMIRDVNGVNGKHFCLVEATNGEEFVLSDCYPVVVRDINKIDLYDIFPISPERAILFACEATINNALSYAKKIGVDEMDVLYFRPLVVSKGKNEDRKATKLYLKKLFPEEVESINDLIIENAEKGYIYKNYKVGN